MQLVESDAIGLNELTDAELIMLRRTFKERVRDMFAKAKRRFRGLVGAVTGASNRVRDLDLDQIGNIATIGQITGQIPGNIDIDGITGIAGNVQDALNNQVQPYLDQANNIVDSEGFESWDPVDAAE